MHNWQRTLRTNWLYSLILIFLIAFPFLVGWLTDSSPFGARGRPVGQSTFWQALLIETFILAILAMSYNLMFGFTGVISFGHALFFGLGGYIMAIFLEKASLGPDSGMIVGLVAGLIITGILGFVIGLVSLRLRGVYFAMFTLAIAEMFYILFLRLPATGSEDGFSIAQVPEWLNPTRSRLSYYYVTLLLLVLTFLLLRRLISSPTGAVLLAIRENESRAQTIGYNTLTFKLLAITLAGMLAALAGMLSVILNKKVGPEMLAVSYTVDPLLMTIIGGIGTFSGPVIGAAGLHLSDRLLRDSQFTIGGTVVKIGESWPLILGISFIVVVLIFPHGVVGTWAQWRTRRQMKAASGAGRSAVPQPKAEGSSSTT